MTHVVAYLEINKVLQYDPQKAEASHGFNRMCTAIGLFVETDHLSTVIANL